MASVKSYFSLVKFSHTIFAMPFAMIGFFLAVTNKGNLPPGTASRFTGAAGGSGGALHLSLLFIAVVLCMVFARSAAMAFNRWLDKHFDALNPRTAIREIPTGIISANRALWFVIINCIAFIACTWFINTLCFYLSFIALAVILGYSYTKRFTPLCHLVLGLGLSLAPIGAYLAVTGTFNTLPVLFSLAVVFWVSGFDIIYALQDEEFDRANRLHSIPAAFGKARALRISEFLHVISAASVIYAGLHWHFGYLYWAGIAVFAGMLVYQHSIVHPNDLRKVNLAFMTANGIASVVFALFVITDLFTSMP